MIRCKKKIPISPWLPVKQITYCDTPIATVNSDYSPLENKGHNIKSLNGFFSPVNNLVKSR